LTSRRQQQQLQQTKRQTKLGEEASLFIGGGTSNCQLRTITQTTRRGNTQH